METNEIYRAALDTFGTESQITMLFEEIGELMVAICRLSRGRDKVAHVAEENADVRIMLDQMAMLFDCEDEVERQKRYKLHRLEQRIEKAKLESNLRVVESDLRVPQTNADRIRAMSDEELAETLYEYFGADEQIHFCQNRQECMDALDCDEDIPEAKCKKCLLERLQQPSDHFPEPTKMVEEQR